MTHSSRAEHDNRDVRAQAALVSGEAFQRLAEHYLPLISFIDELSSVRMPPELGNVAAYATNLELAVELYLKALLTHLGVPYAPRHDLSYLYRLVPGEVRSLVENLYDEARLDDISNLR